jgi:hypothetical protein
MATYYDGPQLTGEAITAHAFCIIDASASPDTMIMADDGTTADIAFVSQVALASGQALYGMQDSGYALLRLVTGQNPAANVALTADYDSGAGYHGATAAVTGDYVYAITVEPASGSAGYVRCKLVDSPIVQP